MNNFFTRLAARSVNPSAAVQPRLASRFENGPQSFAANGTELARSETENSPSIKPAVNSLSENASLPEKKNFSETDAETAEIPKHPPIEHFEASPMSGDEKEIPSLAKNDFGALPLLGETSSRSGPFSKMRRRTAPPDTSPIQNKFAANDGSSNTTTATPAVHVTIGRVEVRAVLPAAPAARKNSPPAEKISLQDHLRNGGRA
jgi:hypothetical protein